MFCEESASWLAGAFFASLDFEQLIGPTVEGVVVVCGVRGFLQIYSRPAILVMKNLTSEWEFSLVIDGLC